MSDTALARPFRGFRRWFLLDGIVTGANALLYLALHSILPDLLGSTSAALLAIGAVLAVVTGGLLVVALVVRRIPGLPELLAGVNAAWAAASFLVALTNVLGLSTIGIVWAVVQGLVVLAFSVLQFRALRRTPVSAASPA